MSCIYRNMTIHIKKRTWVFLKRIVGIQQKYQCVVSIRLFSYTNVVWKLNFDWNLKNSSIQSAIIENLILDWYMTKKPSEILYTNRFYCVLSLIGFLHGLNILMYQSCFLVPSPKLRQANLMHGLVKYCQYQPTPFHPCTLTSCPSYTNKWRTVLLYFAIFCTNKCLWGGYMFQSIVNNILDKQLEIVELWYFVFIPQLLHPLLFVNLYFAKRFLLKCWWIWKKVWAPESKQKVRMC